jgi:outer membrane protein, heavy metal efflux system
VSWGALTTFSLGVSTFLWTSGAGAEEHLTLEQAAERARTKGLEVLLAESNVRAAKGDAASGRALPNPTASFSVGPAFNYTPPDSSASRWQYTATLSDQSLVSELVSGKHALKSNLGTLAVAATEADRTNAERLIVLATKSAYVDLVGARKTLAVAKEVAELLRKMVDLNRERYPKVIDEGVLARVEAEKLEADRSVDQAEADVDVAQASLLLVLGVRDHHVRIAVDDAAIDLATPPHLAGATLEGLVKQALENRADAKQAELAVRRFEVASELARRQRVPEASLFLQYQQQGAGNNAAQPQTLVLGVALPIPLLDRQQGSISRADADATTSRLAAERLANQIVFDVRAAFAAFSSGLRIATRFNMQLLERRRRAFEITKAQFEAGSATLMDFLDAERGLTGSATEGVAALVAYWRSVFALEAAVGRGPKPR